MYANWSDLREKETAGMLAACTRCGACYEACPMTPFIPAAEGVAPGAVVAGVLDLLQGGAGDAAAKGWVSACTRTGSCIPAGPEGVNPMLMLRLAKFQAQENGTLPPRDASRAMPTVKAFARLGFTPDEQEKWL